MVEQLALWFIFSVLLALVPILFNAFQFWTNTAIHDDHSVIARGELLLITAGLVASSTGQLLVAKSLLILPKIIAGGSCVLILLFSSMLFAHISAIYSSGKKVPPGIVERTSIVLYVLAVLASGSCINIANSPISNPSGPQQQGEVKP